MNIGLIIRSSRLIDVYIEGILVATCRIGDIYIKGFNVSSGKIIKYGEVWSEPWSKARHKIFKQDLAKYKKWKSTGRLLKHFKEAVPCPKIPYIVLPGDKEPTIPKEKPQKAPTVEKLPIKKPEKVAKYALDGINIDSSSLFGDLGL